MTAAIWKTSRKVFWAKKYFFKHLQKLQK